MRIAGGSGCGGLLFEVVDRRSAQAGVPVPLKPGFSCLGLNKRACATKSTPPSTLACATKPKYMFDFFLLF